MDTLRYCVGDGEATAVRGDCCTGVEKGTLASSDDNEPLCGTAVLVAPVTPTVLEGGVPVNRGRALSGVDTLGVALAPAPVRRGSYSFVVGWYDVGMTPQSSIVMLYPGCGRCIFMGST